MNEGKILLLRYSDFHGVNTIREHAEVISREGFCWWAKLGKQPSSSYLKDYIEQADPVAVLYTAGALYLCSVGGILKERPVDHFPKYYCYDIFDKENEPSIYFKLLSMESLPLEFLIDYIVCSSGKEVLYDIKKTISSYMFIQHKDAPRKPKRTQQKSIKKELMQPVNKNDCIYRKEGVCTYKRCINYLYECERPQYCTRQKFK